MLKVGVGSEIWALMDEEEGRLVILKEWMNL